MIHRRPSKELVAWGLLTVVVLLPGSAWGIPQATSALAARGWGVDGIGGLGVLSELSNLVSGARADWYVAYPLFHYLVLAAVYAPFLLYWVLTGQLSGSAAGYPYGFTDPVAALGVLGGIANGVSMVMAAGVVCATWVLASRLFDRGAARIAALLVLLNAPFLFYARTGNLDIPVLLWVLLTFVAIERAWTTGLTPRLAIACGALAAVAVATKDQAYGLLVPPLVMLAWRSFRGTHTLPARRKEVALLVAAGVIAFGVANGLVFRPERFMRHVRYITSFEETFANVRNPTGLTVLRPSTVAGYRQLLGDIGRALGDATSWPVVAAGLAGAVLCWRSTPSVRWLVAAGAGFVVLVVAPIHHMQYRYAIGLSVLLSILAAGAVRRLSLTFPSRRRMLEVAAGAGLAAAALPGALGVSYAVVVDRRWEASQWLAANMGPGDTLGFFGRPHQLPLIPAGVHLLMMGDTVEAHVDLARQRPRWIVVAPDYFADPARERSIFLPADLYSSLVNGSLGWQRRVVFPSAPLFGQPLTYLPYVNPQVQVFERASQQAP